VVVRGVPPRTTTTVAIVVRCGISRRHPLLPLGDLCRIARDLASQLLDTTLDPLLQNGSFVGAHDAIVRIVGMIAAGTRPVVGPVAILAVVVLTVVAGHVRVVVTIVARHVRIVVSIVARHVRIVLTIVAGQVGIVVGNVVVGHVRAIALARVTGRVGIVGHVLTGARVAIGTVVVVRRPHARVVRVDETMTSRTLGRIAHNIWVVDLVVAVPGRVGIGHVGVVDFGLFEWDGDAHAAGGNGLGLVGHPVVVLVVVRMTGLVVGLVVVGLVVVGLVVAGLGIHVVAVLLRHD